MTATAEQPAQTASVTILGVIIRPGDVDRELANGAHRWTSFTPERRGEQEQAGYVYDMTQAARRFEAAVQANPALEARAAELLAEYKAGYLSRMNALLHAKSRCASTMITGSSKFPVRRQQKRSDTANRRADELIGYVQTRLLRLLRLLTRPPRSTAAEREAEIRARLEQREQKQAHMKEVNKTIKNKKLAAELAEEGLTITDALVALGEPRRYAEDLQKKDFTGRIGYADYQLTNNGAEIRRLRASLRAAAEQRNEADVTGPSERVVKGVTVEEHPDDNRLRLTFPGKPDETTRAHLKMHGFHWTPSLGVWQRQLTNAARWAAEQVLKALPETE